MSTLSQFAAAGPRITRSARTTNTILAAADRGTLIDCTSGTFSQTLTAAATLGNGWNCIIRNSGAGTITLDPNASELINGASTLVLSPGSSIGLQCTGTEFYTTISSIGFATLNSPIFTGDPTAPTPAVNDADTSIATTAFVDTSFLKKALPQISQSVNYTLLLTDAGKHIFHPSADTTARTFTIPANASVAFLTGTQITLVNQSAAGALTVSITSDTLIRNYTNTTGSIILSPGSAMRILKITATIWVAYIESTVQVDDTMAFAIAF